MIKIYQSDDGFSQQKQSEIKAVVFQIHFETSLNKNMPFKTDT